APKVLKRNPRERGALQPRVIGGARTSDRATAAFQCGAKLERLRLRQRERCPCLASKARVRGAICHCECLARSFPCALRLTRRPVGAGQQRENAAAQGILVGSEAFESPFQWLDICERPIGQRLECNLDARPL